MPDYIENTCECNDAENERTTTPVRACDCGAVDSSKDTLRRIWKETGRSSAHRTSMMASLVVAKEDKPKGVGVKHGSYARYLAKRKACCV